MGDNPALSLPYGRPAEAEARGGLVKLRDRSV
jgi:hypothetical protein